MITRLSLIFANMHWQVNDSLARQDAVALYRFLRHRGYVAEDPAGSASLPALPAELPALKRQPTPLTGVDMIKVCMTIYIHNYS